MSLTLPLLAFVTATLGGASAGLEPADVSAPSPLRERSLSTPASPPASPPAPPVALETPDRLTNGRFVPAAVAWLIAAVVFVVSTVASSPFTKGASSTSTEEPNPPEVPTTGIGGQQSASMLIASADRFSRANINLFLSRM